MQDGAGAALLHPSFTHTHVLDRVHIARSVYDAIHRSCLCSLHVWHRKFDGRFFRRFTTLPAVAAMLQSDLYQAVSSVHQVATAAPPPTPLSHSPAEGTTAGGVEIAGASLQAIGATAPCIVSEVVWAVVTVEVLDFLQGKRCDTPMLQWLVSLPLWLCRYADGGIERSVDAVLEKWISGRLCGSSKRGLFWRACDSECCCHDVVDPANCGCQCPCVCVCV